MEHGCHGLSETIRPKMRSRIEAHVAHLPRNPEQLYDERELGPPQPEGQREQRRKDEQHDTAAGSALQ